MGDAENTLITSTRHQNQSRIGRNRCVLGGEERVVSPIHFFGIKEKLRTQIRNLARPPLARTFSIGKMR